MRAVVQRVSRSSVTVEGTVTGEIQQGLLVLLGVGKEDGPADITYLRDKIVNLRIFEDAEDKMNRSLLDIKGELLVVSQFTLYGDVRKGRRPSFDKAGSPETAKALYEAFVESCRELGLTVHTGQFQAHMMVELVNDGPVTILVDSKKEF